MINMLLLYAFAIGGYKKFNAITAITQNTEKNEFWASLSEKLKPRL